MKKLIVLLAALAATSAIAAGSAIAAPATKCVGDMSAATGWSEVNGNLTVDPGTSCTFHGHVTGTLTVNGSMMMDGSWIDGNTSVSSTGHLKVSNTHFAGNVGVDGGSLKFINTPSWIGMKAWDTTSTTTKNLSITNSTGDIDPNDTNMNGFWAPVYISGNFSYTNNYVPLFGNYGPAAAQHVTIGPTISQ
jgi:hypothetical protein